MGIQSEVKAGLLCYFEHVEMNVRILMPGKCDKLNLTGLLRLNDSFHSATFGKYSGRVVIPQYFVVRQQIDVVCPSASDPASAMLLFFDTTATAIAQKFSPLHLALPTVLRSLLLAMGLVPDLLIASSSGFYLF